MSEAGWYLLGALTLVILIAWLIVERRRIEDRLQPVPGTFKNAWTNYAGPGLTMGEARAHQRGAGQQAHHGQGTGQTEATIDPRGRTRPGWREDLRVTGVAATGTTAVVGVPAAWDWWNPDPAVLAAYGRYRNVEVDNGWELWRSISGADGTGALDIANDAVRTGLRGHLGEQIVAERLQAVGHDVRMPEAGNNPGWDVEVDGYKFNVKVTDDPTRTGTTHLDAHPDVPLLTGANGQVPPSAATWDGHSPLTITELLPESMLTTTPLLNTEDVAAQLAETLDTAAPADALADGVTDSADVLPAGGTVVSVLLSAGREAALLHSGDTDLARAAKNVALDGVGQGLGFLAGAKAGFLAGVQVEAAMAGTGSGAPTAIGTLVGGVGGSRVGRHITTRIKRRPLVRAASDLTDAAESYRTAADEQLTSANHALALERKRADLLVALRSLLAKRTLEAREAKATEAIRAAQHLDPYQLLGAAREDLRRSLTEGDPRLCGRTPGLRLVRARLARNAVERWHQGAARAAAAAYTAPSQERVEELWDWVAVTTVGEAEMRSYIGRVTHAYNEQALGCRSVAAQEAEGLARTQRLASSALAWHRRAQLRTARNNVLHLQERLGAAVNQYDYERRAAGLETSSG